MGFWKKKKSKGELETELSELKSKEKTRTERKKLKSDIRKLKYGKYVEGAKTVGKGAIGVGKGLGTIFDELVPAQKPSKRKGKRRKAPKDDFGLDFDMGF